MVNGDHVGFISSGARRALAIPATAAPSFAVSSAPPWTTLR
jgi:hypothetical protein